jgi:hypothetical protein
MALWILKSKMKLRRRLQSAEFCAERRLLKRMKIPALLLIFIFARDGIYTWVGVGEGGGSGGVVNEVWGCRPPEPLTKTTKQLFSRAAT